MKESFHCSFNFVVFCCFFSIFFFTKYYNLYVFHYFSYASFVIYISIVEIMCVKVMSTFNNISIHRVGQFIMVEETGVSRTVLYNVEWKLIVEWESWFVRQYTNWNLIFRVVDICFQIWLCVFIWVSYFSYWIYQC